MKFNIIKLGTVIRSLVSLPVQILNGADQASSESSCLKHPSDNNVCNPMEALLGRDCFT